MKNNGNIKQLKKDNPEFKIDIIQILANKYPDNPEYVTFLVKHSKEYVNAYLSSGLFIDDCFRQIFDLLNIFDALVKENILKDTDLNSYSDAGELYDFVRKLKEENKK